MPEVSSLFNGVQLGAETTASPGTAVSASKLLNYLNFQLGASHATGLNAYFDVLLQTGWIGLVLFLALAGVALLRSWLDASERRSVIYAWTPLMLVAILIDSMFESFALSGIGWLLLVLLAVRAGKSRSWRERMEGAAPPDLPHNQVGPGTAG